MSCKIEIKRICEYCNTEFTAKTTVTKYCSHKCNQRHYKAKVKEQKINKSNSETMFKPSVRRFFITEAFCYICSH